MPTANAFNSSREVHRQGQPKWHRCFKATERRLSRRLPLNTIINDRSSCNLELPSSKESILKSVCKMLLVYAVSSGSTLGAIIIRPLQSDYQGFLDGPNYPKKHKADEMADRMQGAARHWSPYASLSIYQQLQLSPQMLFHAEVRLRRKTLGLCPK